MRRLAWRRAARADLNGIDDFIAAANPRAAAQFVQTIRQRCAVLCDHPEIGRARDDISSGLRIFILSGNVVVAYRIRERMILVTRVFRGGQDYENILGAAQDD